MYISDYSHLEIFVIVGATILLLALLTLFYLYFSARKEIKKSVYDSQLLFKELEKLANNSHKNYN